MLELSFWLEIITINDLRKSIKTIDPPHSTLIQPNSTSIILRDCGENYLNSIFIPDDFTHIVVFLGIAELSILILIIHSKRLQRAGLRIFFIGYVTATLSRKSVWSRPNSIN